MSGRQVTQEGHSQGGDPVDGVETPQGAAATPNTATVSPLWGANMTQGHQIIMVNGLD